jgi:hypothetical protein
LTVKVKPISPTFLLVGEILLNVGNGLFSTLIVNVAPPLVPPPGVGLKTVIEGVAATRRSDAGIAAVNWVALTSVVVRGLPFNSTTELLLKFVPFTVSVNPGPPTAVFVGEILFNVGNGLLTVKVAEVLVPPPGVPVKTVIEGVPAVRRSDAGIAAVTWVALTNVVVRRFPFR